MRKFLGYLYNLGATCLATLALKMYHTLRPDFEIEMYQNKEGDIPSLFTTYRPRKPVAPNTVATFPLKEFLPPAPYLMK